LRVGITRGRSYASVLVIPRRKMRLCEALKAAMAGLEAPWELMGSSPERGRRRGMGRGAGGVAWGEGGLQEGHHAGSTLLLIWFGQGCCAAAHAAVAARVRRNRKEEEEKRREREKKRKGRKRKEKI
jgi:hypothetical protein